MKYIIYRIIAHLGFFHFIIQGFQKQFNNEITIGVISSIIAIVISDWYWDWYVLNEPQVKKRHDEVQAQADKILNKNIF